MEYSRDDAYCAWLAYAKLSPDKINHLFDIYGKAENVYRDFVATDGVCLEKYFGGDKFGLQELKKHSGEADIDRMLVTMDEHNIGLLLRADSDFPDQLREIPDAPWLLFYRGNIACLKNTCVTIVGSRNASAESQKAAYSLARELSNAGITIVSGLAGGIDSAAHKGCLQGKSPTAAVVACGLDTIYPAFNKELAEKIIDSGGVILSEQNVGATAKKWDFPYRNRLISGLSDGVVVMECGIRSGTMRTVEHALNQGKTLFAYPGIPGSTEAEGTHMLLREGATFFTKASDIIEDLEWEKNAPSRIMAKEKEYEEMQRVVRMARRNPSPTADSKADEQHDGISEEQESVKNLNNAEITQKDAPKGSSKGKSTAEEAAAFKLPDEVLSGLPENERIIAGYLQENGETSFDQLCAATHLDPSKMNITLTMLTIKGIIRPLPGKTYCIKQE